MDGKCARCLAGLCDHQGCGAASKVEAVTDVAGTSCCGACAPVLLELVLHPAPVRVSGVSPEIWATGGSGAFTPQPHTGGGAGDGNGG
jgi:hypothetical protein